MKLNYPKAESTPCFEWYELIVGEVYQHEQCNNTINYIVLAMPEGVVRLVSGRLIPKEELHRDTFYPVVCELDILEELSI